MAFDFCVCYSALDGAKSGFETFVIKDATLSVNPEDETLVNKEYKKNGVKIISTKELDEHFNNIIQNDWGNLLLEIKNWCNSIN